MIDSAASEPEHEQPSTQGWIAGQLEDVARRGAPGTVPGEVRRNPDANPVHVRVLQYDASEFQEVEITDLSEIPRYAAQPYVTWVNVDGLRDTDKIEQVCKSFGIHGLVVEDIVHPHQRAKVEDYNDYTFLVARMPEIAGGFDSEQIGIVMCGQAVLTFQEKPGDCLEPVRNRLRHNRGRIRGRGHDYLVYALLDCIVDAYFPVLARVRDRLDEVEHQLMRSPTVDVVAILQRLRTILFVIRNTIAPHQDAVGHLLRSEVITEDTKVYLRDCRDHVHQVLDVCETTRELAADLRDYCFAEISFNQNETMKTLTVMASVFIPLSFIAGLYGMNFDPQVSPYNMPETRWVFGYPFAIALMLAVSGLTLAGLRWMSRTRRRARRRRFARTQRILDD